MKTIEIKPGGRHVQYDPVFLIGNPDLKVFEDGVLLAPEPEPAPVVAPRKTLALKGKGKKK